MTLCALPRPRLSSRLALLLQPPACAVWVAAGAGMGKTTLARQWLPEGGLWLEADEASGCAPVMLRRLQRDAAAPVWREQLAAPGALRAAWRRAWAALPPAASVVLDDLLAAGDDEALATWLPVALDACPAGARVLLLSRRPPPPALARLLLAGRVRVLPAAELAFSDEELAAWQPAAPAGWGRWPAALSTAVPEAERPAQLRQLVLHELLADAPAGTRERLALLAWLPDTVTTTDAAALAGAEAPAALDALARRGLLVDATPQGWQLHDLLAEALRTPAAWAPTVEHLRAVGRDDAALVAALRGCRAGLGSAPLAACVAAVAPRWLAECRHRALADACAAVPEAERDAAVWAALAAALAPTDPRAGRDAAIRALEAAAPGQVALRRAALAQVIASYFQAFDRTEPLAHGLAQLQAMPGTPDDATAVAAYSALFLREPAHPALPAWEARVATLPSHAADPNLRLRATMLLAKQAWYTGRHAALGLMPAQARAALDAPGRSPYALLLWGLARQYQAWALADLAGGRQASADALAAARAEGLHGLDRHLLLHDACFAELAGDRAAAMQAWAAAAEGADTTRRMEAWHLFTVQAWLALEAGDLPQATEAASLAIDAGAAMGPAPQAMSWAVAGQAALAQGRVPTEALAALRRGAAVNPRAALLADWLQAGARRLHGDAHEAEAALQRALLAMQQAGGGLWFGLHRAGAADAAAWALERGIATQAALQLVRQHALAPPPCAGPHWPWPVRLRRGNGLQIEIDGVPLVWPARQPRRPLELLELLVDLGGAAPATLLADRLWPEAEGDRALAAFEVALRRLRTLLGHADALRLSGGVLSLDRGRLWIDGRPAAGARHLGNVGVTQG